MRYMTCPVCLGEGYVFYPGTTGPWGNDPPGEEECPTCYDGKVLTVWGTKYLRRKRLLQCPNCFEYVPVAWVYDADGRVLLCYRCYVELEQKSMLSDLSFLR